MIDKLTSVSDRIATTRAEGRANRAAALAAGAHTYVGHPCVACRNAVRYVGNTQCKACSDGRTVAYLRAHKERIYAQKRERWMRGRTAAQMKTPRTVHEAGGAFGSLSIENNEHEYCTEISH